MFVFKKFLLVGRSTRHGPVLAVLISPTHKMTNLLVIPWETVSGSSFAYEDVGANTLLEFGDKFIHQDLDVCGYKV